MKKILKSIFLLVLVMGSYLSSSAQCAAPDTVNVSLTNITCAGSGAVSIDSILDGSGSPILRSNCRYSLCDATNTIVKPEQSSPIFAGLDSGTYILHVYQICDGSDGLSHEFTKTLTLTGYYIKPMLGAPVVVNEACGGDGSIVASATKGYGSYQYCLVDSVNAPKFPTHYVRPLQSATTFSSLPGGTYYLRVYDECSGYVTTPVTIVPGTAAADPIGFFSIDYETCDSFALRTSMNWMVPRSPYTAWWSFPDGTADTLKTDRGLGEYFYWTISKSRISSYYPAPVVFHYQNACGNIFADTITIREPKIWGPHGDLRFTSPTSFCDKGMYQFRASTQMKDSANFVFLWGTTGWSDAWTEYSLDSVNWFPYTHNSDTIMVDKGAFRKIYYKYCDQVFSVTVTMDTTLQQLTFGLQPISGLCEGSSGIAVRFGTYNGLSRNINVHIVSKPVAQPAIPDFYWPGNGDQPTAAPLMNLVPGKYVLQLTDQCGATRTDSITIVSDPAQFSVWPIINCGATKASIGVTFIKGMNVSFNRVAEIYDSTGAKVASDSRYFDGGDSVMLFNGLNPGRYKVRVWLTDLWAQFNGDSSCRHEYTIDARIPLPLAMDKSVYAICTNDITTGAIIALPYGGVLPYQYTLFKDVVSPATQVGTSQTSNIFSGLDVATKYIISVTDGCGAGTAYTHTFDNIKPVVGTSIPYVPCVGDSITLSVAKMPGLYYSWAKNGLSIPGATDTFYQIKPMTKADSGVYNVVVSANSCLILSRNVPLNPAVCGDFIALPLNLTLFSGALNAQNNAILHWSIGHAEPGAHFDVLYSTDGSNFLQAGSVMQDGYTTSFSFLHSDYTVKGKTFYKLRLTAANGTVQYSNTLMFQAVDLTAGTYSVSPVPFTTYLGIDYSSLAAGTLTLSLTDVSGRIVRNMQANIGAGSNHISFGGLDNLPAGLYLLSVTDASGNRRTLKVQK